MSGIVSSEAHKPPTERRTGQGRLVKPQTVLLHQRPPRGFESHLAKPYKFGEATRRSNISDSGSERKRKSVDQLLPT